MSVSNSNFVVKLRWLLNRATLTVLVLSCATFSAAWAIAQAPDKDAEKSGAEAKTEETPAEEPAEEPAAKPEGPVEYLTLPVAKWLRPDYRNLDDKKDDADRRTQRADIRKLIDSIQKEDRGDSIKDDKKARTFDGYYTNYFFAQMTLPERAGEFAKDRQEFFNRHMGPIKSDEVHDRLVDLTYKTMLDIAKGNYHPAARYNAMLIIGELNSKEAVRVSSTPSAPEPLRIALGAMLKELDSPTQIDAVRVACLVGILRHAEMDGQKANLELRWQPQIKTKVIDTMLAQINAKSPKGRTAEGHVWMQRRAIDVLGAIGDHGAEGMVAKKLESLIADNESYLSLRCSAAVALGRINALAQAKIDPAEASQKLADLALQAGKYEIARLEAEKKNREDYLKPHSDDSGSGKGGGFGPGGSSPGGPGGLGPGGPGGLGPGGPGGKIGQPPGAGPGGLGPGGPGGKIGQPPGVGPGAGGPGAGGPGAGGPGAGGPGGKIGQPPGVGPGAGGPGGVGPGGPGGGSAPRPGGLRGFQGSGSGGLQPSGPTPGSGAGKFGGPGAKQPGGVGGVGGMGGIGGMGGGNKKADSSAEDALKEEIEYRDKYKLEISCRRLKYELFCVKMGLEGSPARPKAGLKIAFDRDPHKTYIEKVVNKIDEINKVIEKADPKLEPLLKDLKLRVSELEKLASAAPTAKKPETAPADAPADGPGADGPDGPAAPPAKPAAGKPETPADGPEAPAK